MVMDNATNSIVMGEKYDATLDEVEQYLDELNTADGQQSWDLKAEH